MKMNSGDLCLFAALLLWAIVLTGCATIGFGGMSKEQIAEVVKNKSAGVICSYGTYAGAHGGFVVIENDKGMLSNVTVDSSCKITFGSVIPSATQPTVSIPVEFTPSVGAPVLK